MVTLRVACSLHMSMMVVQSALRKVVYIELLWLLVCFWSCANAYGYRASWGTPSGHAKLMPAIRYGLSKVHTADRIASPRFDTSLRAFTRGPMMKMPRISPHEQELFDVLLKVVADCKLNTTVRVAGGWVRDRLLRMSNQKFDVDIALENMSGVQFRSHLQSWLKSPQGQLPYPFRLSVIPQNADKSKHLETGMYISARQGATSADIIMIV